jgi:signal transduction histidine kinase
MSKDLAPTELLRLISLKEVFGGFAHEIAQPFNAIMIASQVVRLKVERARLAPDQESFLCRRLDLIADQVRRATDIVDELRSFGSEKGREDDRTDLKEVFEKVHGLMAQQFVSRGIDLIWNAPEKPASVSIDFHTAQGILAVALAFARDTVQAVGARTDEHAASFRKTVSVELQAAQAGVSAVFKWSNADLSRDAVTQDLLNNTGITIAGSIVSAKGGALETAADALTVTFPV